MNGHGPGLSSIDRKGRTPFPGCTKPKYFISAVVAASIWLMIAHLTVQGWPSDYGPTCKIAILDTSQESGLGTRCNADLRLHTINGQILVNESSIAGESHIYGQYSAPYWVVKGIRESRYYTSNEMEADAIYVNDYCLVMSVTAGMHSKGFSDGYNPSSALRLCYDAITKSSRYQETAGLDYVFFSPHPLTGIAGYRDYGCNAFGRALHIIVEATQRYVCRQAEARSSFLVVPYASPHFVEDNRPWPTRDILLFFHGDCGGESEDTHGRRMRLHVVRGIQNAADERVSATCRHDRPEVAHETLMTELKRSIFCLIIPGQTSSSSRLTEVMLSGCIPTFVGPPWHAMPLASEILYPDFSVIVELHSLRHLGDGSVNLSEPSIGASSVFDHRWWTSSADIGASARKVESPKGILQALQDIPDFEIEALQRKGAEVRPYFRYRHVDSTEALQGPGTATESIIQHICRRARTGHHPSRFLEAGAQPTTQHY